MPRPQQLVLNPKETWKRFQSNNDNEERRERKSNSKRVENSILFAQNSHLKGLRGPRGPRGPQGPPGPTGSNLNLQEIYSLFRQMIDGSFQTKSYELATNLCDPDDENCSAKVNLKSLLHQIPEKGPSQIPLFFTWHLNNEFEVPMKTFKRLRGFKKPTLHHRGESLRPVNGEMRVTQDGIYNFYVNLYFIEPQVRPELEYPWSRNNITASICVNRDCLNEVHLKSVYGMTGRGLQATISVNGFLYLNVGQVVSVFIKNNSEFSIKILPDSVFSAYQAGV